MEGIKATKREEVSAWVIHQYIVTGYRDPWAANVAFSPSLNPVLGHFLASIHEALIGVYTLVGPWDLE